MTNLERVLRTLQKVDIAIAIRSVPRNDDCLYASRISCGGCPIEEKCGCENVEETIAWLESECDT